MWGVGYNLVVARKRRLLRRYAVTPMRRGHFLLSYFFSRILFLGLELGVLLGFGTLVFGTVMRGSYGTIGLVAFLGAAAFAAVSLVIGARVENTDVANGWINFVQLPMWVLSGAFFSYERFPEWLHAPIRFLPLTALVDSLRTVSNAGATLVDCLPQIAVMSVWCAAGFFVALRTFRWQ
jgi:ABC-type multidrug transport system permease subunit